MFLIRAKPCTDPAIIKAYIKAASRVGETELADKGRELLRNLQEAIN